MLSVNTNVGAMVALQNLTKTNADLAMTQTASIQGFAWPPPRTTAERSRSPRTCGETWARSGAVGQSLDRTRSVVDVALAAGTAVSDLLVQMKEKSLASVDASLDATSRAALNNDFVALRDQIASIVANASFNGVNVVNSGTNITALANQTGSARITVVAQNMSLAGTIVTIAANQQINTIAAASASAVPGQRFVDEREQRARATGTTSKRLELQGTFIKQISDSTKAGIGNLVDADMAQETRRCRPCRSSSSWASRPSASPTSPRR